MNSSTVVIIGGGHSGLAMSKCLSDRSIDHVVLERGQVANSWKTERWDSLRLLTPNWQIRLPGFAYEGDDPDGYMDMAELIEFIEAYSVAVDAPIQTETTVTSVSRTDDGSLVDTDQGSWSCRSVVLASGACNIASVPPVAEGVPDHVEMFTPTSYRNPDQLSDGGVLVVGASATGAQLAEEIQRSGRQVTLSVGEHVRLPRVYRGKDIQWWMDAVGVLDERYDEIDDIRRARGVPSPQLVGTPQRATLDLNSLMRVGIMMRGRLAGIRDGKAQFSGGLLNVCALADLKMGRLLTAIDEWVADAGMESEVAPAETFVPTALPDSPPLSLDLSDGEIKSIVWATGYKSDYSWLDVPVLDRKGRVKHDGGVVESPGMYLLGHPYLRRRKSSFIHGSGDDANELSDHLVSYLTDPA